MHLSAICSFHAGGTRSALDTGWSSKTSFSLQSHQTRWTLSLKYSVTLIIRLFKRYVPLYQDFRQDQAIQGFRELPFYQLHRFDLYLRSSPFLRGLLAAQVIRWVHLGLCCPVGIKLNQLTNNQYDELVHGCSCP